MTRGLRVTPSVFAERVVMDLPPAQPISHNTPSTKVNEWEIAKVITDFLATRTFCGPKPVLSYLKQHYKIRKFESLGYGKFSHFVKKWRIIFQKPQILKPTQEELVEVIRQSYEKYGRINYALTDVRNKFGSGPFGQFGFGIFRDFCIHHSKEIYGSDSPGQYRPGRGKNESQRDDELQRQALLEERQRDRSPKRSTKEPSLDELRNRVRSSIKGHPSTGENPPGPVVTSPFAEVKCYELFPTTIPKDDLPLSSNKDALVTLVTRPVSPEPASSGYTLFPQEQIKDDLPLTSWRDQGFSSDVDRFLASFHYRDRSPPRYRDRSPPRYRDRSPPRYRDRSPPRNTKSSQGKRLPIFMSTPN